MTLRNRRGISTIRIVILVAVVTSLFLGLGCWSGLINNRLFDGEYEKDYEASQGNIGGNQTQFGSLEIQNTLCILEDGNWTITLKLKNIGSTTSILMGVFVNNVEVDFYGKSDVVQNAWATDLMKGDPISANDSLVVRIFLDPGRPLSLLVSKTKIIIGIRSFAGMEYNKLVELV